MCPVKAHNNPSRKESRTARFLKINVVRRGPVKGTVMWTFGRQMLGGYIVAASAVGATGGAVCGHLLADCFSLYDSAPQTN